MREIKLIQFTYEDVRIALQKAYPELGIEGIKLCMQNGYLVQMCARGDEPASVQEPGDPSKEAA